ncbi:MAG: hypothetical protein WA234_06810, partial [Rectinemataceae bacterium]
YVLGALFFVTAFSMAIINKSSTGTIEALVTEQAQQTTNTEWWKSDTTATSLAPGATAPAETPAAAPAESTTQTTTK